MGNAVKRQNRQSARSGFTLLELVIASLILGILSVGALGYQYHATRDARNAEVLANAGRIIKIMLDHWKGMGGKTDFDPAALLGSTLTISPSAIGPATPDADGTAFTTLGRYRVQTGSVYYYITCAYSEASSAQPCLLNVAAAWRPDYKEGVLDDTIHQLSYSVYCSQ